MTPPWVLLSERGGQEVGVRVMRLEEAQDGRRWLCRRKETPGRGSRVGSGSGERNLDAPPRSAPGGRAPWFGARASQVRLRTSGSSG